MTIRKVTLAEMAEVAAISNFAFRGAVTKQQTADFVKRLEETADTCPADRSDMSWRDTWAAFDDKTGRMMGSIHSKPYDLRYNGHTIKMAGIGGVTMLPEYRRGGAIRECFRAMLKEVNERGFVISQLYPFSDAFYRRFGYENALRVANWVIPLSSIPAFPVTGTIEAFHPGDDWRPYAEVFEKMCARYEFSSIRSEVDWRGLQSLDCAATRRLAYLYRAEDGTPKGYIIYHDEGREMLATGGWDSLYNFMFVDLEGAMGLLNFVRGFSSYTDNLHIDLPEAMNIEPLLSMHNPVKVAREFRAEARVINVEQMLRLSKYKGGRGELRIAVTDPFGPWNEGTWAVHYCDGKATAVAKSSCEPDVELTIQDFTRLIMGSFSAEDIWMLPDAKVHHGERLGDLFYHKDTLLLEHF